MFAKLAFNGVRKVSRRAVTRSRNRLVAVWRWDPASGRLELKWMAGDRSQDATEVPGRSRPASRPDVQSTRRRSRAAALVMRFARETAA
jgi:hypothetical protein